jgi:hypothetical protein
MTEKKKLIIQFFIPYRTLILHLQKTRPTRQVTKCNKCNYKIVREKVKKVVLIIRRVLKHVSALGTGSPTF